MAANACGGEKWRKGCPLTYVRRRPRIVHLFRYGGRFLNRTVLVCPRASMLQPSSRHGYGHGGAGLCARPRFSPTPTSGTPSPTRARPSGGCSTATGLYLQASVAQSALDINRNWVFRYELDGDRHDYGIGPYPAVSLAEARRRAGELRLLILDGIDPLQERIESPQGAARREGQAGEGQDVQGVRRTLLRDSPQGLEERGLPQAMALEHGAVTSIRSSAISMSATSITLMSSRC